LKKFLYSVTLSYYKLESDKSISRFYRLFTSQSKNNCKCLRQGVYTMNQDIKRALLLTTVFIGLAGCQSAPENDGLDNETPVAAMEDESSDTDAYGAGDRAEIDSMSDDNMEEDEYGMEYGEGDEVATSDMLSTTVFYFDFDQSSVRSDALDALRAHAQYLNSNPEAEVRIEGHGDERGTREYNVALGERRGNAVQKYLRLNGVAANQMEVVSYGEEKPVAFGHDEKSWSANRRVEIVYIAGQP